MSQQQAELNKEWEFLWDRHAQSYQELQEILQELKKDEVQKPTIEEIKDVFNSQSNKQ